MGRDKPKTMDEFMKSNFVVCSCGYNNKMKYVKVYGTCLKCGKILNEKANFSRQLFLKMRDKQRKVF